MSPRFAPRCTSASLQAIFSFGGTLESLETSQVSNRDAAIKNAREFAGEILALFARCGLLSRSRSLAREVA